ncbi:MAG: S8 family serine peptidase, partial [Alphaproteobacteria bacterium]|nr:S8 family serine peptidase [Alphaproteobacteria bacterium]
PPPPPPPPPGGSFPATGSAEFLANWGPGGVEAQAGWTRGFNGAGVLIGVIDDGVYPDHPELQGRISALSRDINGSRNQLTGPGTHGSELSALIAGNFNGASTVGVAYGATILAVRADEPGPCPDNSPSRCGFFNADLSAALDYAVANGVRVVNLSLGSSTRNETFAAAVRRATQAGVILVVSAGNDGPAATEVNYPGRLALEEGVSNGLVIIAGGMNPNGAFNTRSNQAGQAAPFYVTAPGWEIIVPDFANPGPTDPAFQLCFADLTCRIQGTSYASPHITGAVAILIQAFPGLAPRQVVDLVFASTIDIGSPGIDPQTGRGVFNLERAFRPVGALTMATTTGEVSPYGLLGALGRAFGDGPLSDPAVWRVAAFDSFGRTFEVSLAPGWTQADDRLAVVAPPLWRSVVVAGGGAAMRFSIARPDQVEAAPASGPRWLTEAAMAQTPALSGEALFGPDLALRLAVNGAPFGDIARLQGLGALSAGGVAAEAAYALSPWTSVALSMSQSPTQGAWMGLPARSASARAAQFAIEAGRWRAALGVAMQEERGSVLGTAWREDLGTRPQARSTSASASLVWRHEDALSLSAALELGQTRLAEGGFLRGGEPFATSAWRLSASHALVPLLPALSSADAQLELSVSQPLRVENGSFHGLLPTADAYGRRSLSFESRRIEAAPSGREMRLEASYRAWIADSASLSLEAVHVLEPGHRADAERDTSARVGLRFAY